MTRYPVENDNVTERGRAFLSTISSFWLSMHQDKQLFRQYAAGMGEYLAQQLVDLLYTVNTLSRHFMPVTRPFNWRQVSFRQSDLETSAAGALTYGTEAVYGIASDNFTIRLYGDRSTSAIKKLDVSEDFVHASVLTDTPVEPSVVLTCGTDFWFDADTSSIQFRTDPFTLSYMPIVEILDSDGEVSDREISLWAFDCEYDVDDMSEHYGILVGLTSTSSEAYSKLVDSALDLMVDGPSFLAFKTFMASLAGERVVQSDGEVVEDVASVGDEWVVATDRNVYSFSSAATPQVSVGDVVNRGDLLSDAVEVLDHLSQLESLDGWLLDERLCGSLGQDLIGFGNEDVALELETVNGFTKVSATLHGSPRAVRKFWEDVHARGIAEGTTLADLLDLRSEPTSQPGVEDLPKTVNPLRLLLNEMRGSLLVVRITPASFSALSPEVDLGTIVRRLLPARFVTILLIETPTNIEYIRLDDFMSSSTPWTSTSVGLGVAFGDAYYDSVPSVGTILGSDPGYTDVGPVIWTEGAPCPEG